MALVRFYLDPVTGEAHLLRHGVSEEDAFDILKRPLEDRPGKDGARVAVGRARSGLFVRVVYVPDPEGNSLFVITAYPLGPKAQKALKRRLRRKQ